VLVPRRKGVSDSPQDHKTSANPLSDGNIRYYEYENDKFEYLSEYKSGDPQRGIAFLPKRGINLHENEVLRCFKTVNDAYVEPVSFIVPRRSEMFQSDIYPPTNGLKPGVSAKEWFAGKTAAPPKISLESVYEGEAPVEVASEYKPSQPATGPAAPLKTEPPKPAPEPTPAPVASRGPPPQMKDNKESMASAASKYTDKDETSDDESASSFEEIPKPADRRTFTAARQEQKTQGPAITKEPQSESARPSPTTSHAPSQSVSSPSTQSTPTATTPAPAASSTPTSGHTPTPSTGGPASALRDALGDIKHQLEHQNKVMSDQSDQIALLLREVSQLKMKSNGNSEPSTREKDERIRQLELELEEARS
jgi:coronin-1B/1C/6